MNALSNQSFHPLELIPFFRRFPASRARNLLYTIIWNAILGSAFLVISSAVAGRLPSARLAWIYFVIANFIGFAIHALFEGGKLFGIESWAKRRSFAAKTVYFTLIPTLGVIAGFQAADWVANVGFANWLVSPEWIISIAATSLFISFILSVTFYLREREARALAELEAERARSERMQREAVAAGLRALQAQIEPHFLFNTLANVTSLIGPDPAKARRMLESFIRFLRASLGATRGAATTLADEADLIAAYLDVLEIRMGNRLRYEVDVPSDLHAFSLPPMLLQPVVENAIRHGLEPKMDGGRVAVRARREGASVVVEVSDDGAGFAATTRGGVGLTNLRDRLRLLYGDRAALTIGERAGGGARVCVRLPA